MKMQLRQITLAAATIALGSAAFAAPWNFDESSTSFQTTSSTDAANAPAGLSIKGFGDIQYRISDKVDTDGTTTGFVVNDSALYLSHTLGATQLFLDLPFGWDGNATLPATTTAGNGFYFGRRKAQAFVSYSMEGTKFQLGQFDTFFGLELNDSPDIIFSSQGLLYRAMLPVTHTGLQVSHTMGMLTGRVMVANAPDQGSQNGQSSAYAGQLSWANEMFRVAAGYHAFNPIQGETQSLIDAIVGMTWAGLTVDVEGTWLTVPTADATTGAVTKADGQGILVLPTYAITNSLSVAARYEMLSDGSYAGAAFEDATWITAGFQFQMTDALRMKVDYTMMDYDRAGGTSDDGTMGAVSAVYKF